MLRRWTVAAAVAGLVLGVLTPLASAEDEILHYAGIVLAVDADEGTLTVEEASLQGPQVRFMIADETEITRDGGKIDLARIEVGDPVSIDYRKTEDGNEAEAVEIITPPTS